MSVRGDPLRDTHVIVISLVLGDGQLRKWFRLRWFAAVIVSMASSARCQFRVSRAAPRAESPTMSTLPRSMSADEHRPVDVGSSLTALFLLTFPGCWSGWDSDRSRPRGQRDTCRTHDRDSRSVGGVTVVDPGPAHAAIEAALASWPSGPRAWRWLCRCPATSHRVSRCTYSSFGSKSCVACAQCACIESTDVLHNASGRRSMRSPARARRQRCHTMRGCSASFVQNVGAAAALERLWAADPESGPRQRPSAWPSARGGWGEELQCDAVRIAERQSDP